MNFSLSAATPLLGTALFPLLIYLLRDSSVISSSLILWRAQVPLLLQSVRLQACFISCHLPQQFKIIPDFKLENRLLIFPVNHCWKAACICLSLLSWKKEKPIRNFLMIRDQLLFVSCFLLARKAKRLYYTENMKSFLYSTFAIV